ncbi:hypothetical protein SAMN05428953_12643 [Mesorhizobium muleiense]|uniref:Uncharacterized protein n=1 Tax=Mesorhizobium muleiense TaxID=1004279 RepID=A0A1G9H218_9HYPH|nr:hypothetical protein [Mesorhizobium muleiense]SDL06951.1 hypothetical protein SAMN05428953_12643 [Mesorhizobium muleiense]
MIKTLRRWRTWIFNILAAAALALPDILQSLGGIYWGDIVPPKYLPYFTIFVVLTNIWMRPRAAVLPDDDEASK